MQTSATEPPSQGPCCLSRPFLGLLGAVTVLLVLGVYAAMVVAPASRSPQRATLVPATTAAAPPWGERIRGVATDPVPVVAVGDETVAPVPAPVSQGSAVIAPPADAADDDDCAAALAYLAAEAAPGFAHFCRPGAVETDAGPVAAYTCVPGSITTCPDGVAEIIIAEPGCANSYRNEASNSHWDFSRAGSIRPGARQGGRTWDPFGPCPRPRSASDR